MGEDALVIIAAGQDRGYHDLVDAAAVRALNTAQDKICGWEAWPFLRLAQVEEALEATGIITLDSEPRLLHGVYEGAAGQERPLDYLRSGHVKARYPKLVTAASSLAGRAVHFTTAFAGLDASDVRVLPCLGGERIVVDFTRRPTVITGTGSGGQPVTIPQAYSDVLIDAWVLEAAKRQHDWDTVAGLREELAYQRARMTEELLDAQDSDHDRMMIVMGDPYE